MGPLAAINLVASAVSRSLNLDVTLQTALQSVLSVIRVRAAAISLVDDDAGDLVLRAQRGLNIDFVSPPMRIPLGVGMSGTVVRDDTVLVTGDLTDDPRLAVPEFADEGVQAMVLVPMHAQGRVVGILSVMDHQPYEFSEEEIAMLRAIADQVGVALDNARLYERTREQSSRLSAVLHSSGDAIIATDHLGNIDLINSTAERLFSIRTRDLIGLPLRHMPLHPKLREGLLRAMQGETDSNSDDGTERRRAADSPEDGTEVNTAFEVVLENGRFLSVIVSPVYAHRELGQDREPEGWVMVIQDVTHLRQAEQTRVNFIHAAAHDLRAPLGVAMGSLTMLATELEGSGHNTAEYQEIIDLGVRGIMRMETLIDDLLSLEHVESGIGLQSQLIDVRDLVERSTADITPAIQQREQTLTVDVPDTVPPIMGDMHWLCRALFNLLGNANKYTPPGGELALRVYMQDEELVIEVSDNGPGIAPDVQPRLFERFFRAPATRRAVRGTGLGLAIVKSVAEQHGGRVFVQSRVGQGSIFGMVFPLAAS